MVIYFVWGSGYLAASLALRPGSGLGPCYLSAARVLGAGLTLVLFSGYHRLLSRLTRDEIRRLFLSGLCMWGASEVLIFWAMQKCDSGYSAVCFASAPLWATAIELFLKRRSFDPVLCLILLLGFLGVVILTVPHLVNIGNGLEIAALIASAFLWSLGSVFSANGLERLPVVVTAGYQQILGGVTCLAFALLVGEPFPHPTWEAGISLLYLTIFGSVLGFVSYLKAMERLPLPVVMSFAYVNPPVAILFGALFLSEKVSVSTGIGMLVITMSVALLFRKSESPQAAVV